MTTLSSLAKQLVPNRATPEKFSAAIRQTLQNWDHRRLCQLLDDSKARAGFSFESQRKQLLCSEILAKNGTAVCTLLTELAKRNEALELHDADMRLSHAAIVADDQATLDFLFRDAPRLFKQPRPNLQSVGQALLQSAYLSLNFESFVFLLSDAEDLCQSFADVRFLETFLQQSDAHFLTTAQLAFLDALLTQLPKKTGDVFDAELLPKTTVSEILISRPQSLSENAAFVRMKRSGLSRDDILSAHETLLPVKPRQSWRL